MDINLNYVPSEAIGYGRLGVKLSEALTRAGVEVFDHMPCPPGVSYDVKAAAGRHAGRSGNICWISVPTHATGWYDSQTTSIFTMWEAMRLPEQFREWLHHFDTVMVPSDQNVELFGRYHPNVKRVLLGIDPAEWHYIERTPPDVYFDFLIGGSGARKGTDLAFEAFKRAFPHAHPSRPIPRLIMKNPRGEDFQFDGRVMVIGGKLSAEEERDLYAQAHCYLQPSRGEGFGLQPLQALAQGCPTILTDAHGHESFAHLGYGISAKPADASYFIYGDAGQWWEPDLDELVEAMRFVYDNWGQACADATVAARCIRETMTWDDTARQFMDCLDLRKPFTPGDWVDPHPLKYRIRTVRDWRCNIAGRPMIFKAGVDYWELADVKRIFAEAGSTGAPILDPECLAGEDLGLTDEQIAALGLPSPVVSRDGDADMTLWHAGAV